MLAIVGPLVDENLEQATANQNSEGDKDCQAIDCANRQTKFPANSPEPEKDRNETKGVTQSIKPKVDSADFQKYGIDSMNEGTKHKVSNTPLAEIPDEDDDSLFGVPIKKTNYPNGEVGVTLCSRWRGVVNPPLSFAGGICKDHSTLKNISRVSF
jgi:hypothetical protein